MSIYNRLSEALKATTIILGGGHMVQADEIEEATEQPKVEPSLARFLDVVTFLESLELATATLAPDSPLRSQALLLAKQTQPDFLVDAATYLEPLFGIRGLGKGKLKWKALARVATNHDKFVARGTFLRNFIRDLAAKPQVFRDTFPDTRLLTAARKLAQVSEAKTAPEALVILGSMRSLSGLVRLRNWNREAAAESGVQISEFDDVVAAVGEAQDLGHQLATTEAQLQSPQTASEAERLEAERDEIKSKIESVALTSPNAEAVLAVAAQAAQPRAYQTKTGEQLGLDQEQEDAMMVRGKAIIASGAGSGKTRVLAGKVVYHVKELGVRPSQIIATSFSKKSGDELVERIRKYGGEAITEDSYALEGFGTTHSIALKLLKRALPRLKGRDTIIKDSGVKYLMKMAMQQVRMRPQQATQPQPFDPNESFFAQRPLQAMQPEQPVETGAPQAPVAPPGPGLQPVAPGGPADDATIKRLAQEALNRGRFADWPTQFLTDMARRGAGRRDGLTDKQKAALIRLLNQAGVDPTPISGAMMPVPMLLPQVQDAGTDVQAMPEGLDYFKVPANQWFNLGLGDDAFKDEKGRPLGPKQVGMYLTRWRADLVTPGQAAAQAVGMPPEIAAAYGAYEWLKHNHSDFAGKIDFDDMLIMACQQLVASPRLLAECQNRWKLVLVDEVQDLNAAQHLLFGLIAGYYDPATQQPWPDHHMTADTFAMIGDDKQAIFGFRGADVELFIDRSDLVGGPFVTKKISTNYRSGKVIIEAAGKLISHNSKQVPMECKANEARKGAGFIHAKVVANHEAGAAYVAEEVHDLVTSGAETYGEPKGVPTFGIGVRTNAESYAFAAECLKRGIPFKSKVNFFNDKTTKAILHWLVLASKPGDQNAVNEAVLEAHGAPRFFLDKVFEHKLQEKARGQSYLAYLEGGGWRTIYDGRMVWKNEKNVLPYMKALRMVTDLGTQASPKEILEIILNIKGIGVGKQPAMSMIDTLIEDAKDDPELLDTIREETEGEPGLEGQITDDDVKALALAPIQPLMGLLEGYNDLGQAMLYVEKLKDANKKLAKGKKADDEDEDEANEPAVIIDTVHGWKGLEAKRMYVPMPSGTFPHAKSTTEEALAAERRLGYVAITRGQDRVTILAPLVNHQGKPSGPSVFVSEACIAVEGQAPSAPTAVPVATPGAPPVPTVAAAIDFATLTLHEIAALLSAEQTTESLLADEDQSAPEDLLLLTDPNAEPEPEAEEEPTMDEVTEVASASLALSQDLLASLKEKP